MEIAKGVLNTDYLSLNLDKAKVSNDWDIAFNYFEKRISERFIEPINKLIEAEDNLKPFEKKFGFSVLALDCLLVETIQSFYEGKTNSSSESKKIFKRFLRQREGFKEHFITDKLATDFYYKFRCGILHQAQTSSDTKIWTIGKLISINGNYLIVNRVLFHEKIITVFDNYLKELRTKKNIALMENFKKKMDYIARN
jgi:hypothetical protein